MTPEQAANHPSKNVISRALGAESTVEADMKVIDVDDGSFFLLCTDGITRHLPDHELRELLTSDGTPSQICEEMKRRCYQRGAEDNLTAVIVQVGTPQFERHPIEDESTVSFEMEPTEIPSAPARLVTDSTTQLTPPSRIAFPAPSAVEQTPAAAVAATESRSGRGVFRFLVFLLFVTAGAGAFYAGMIYQRQRQVTLSIANAQPTPSPQSTFAGKRADLDADPQKWLTTCCGSDSSSPIQLDSKDAEFLYLYGRAKMLMGDHRGALEAFELALNKIRSESKNELPLDTELRLADAAAALKLNQSTSPPSQQASMAEQKAISALDSVLGTKTPAK
jgi:Stage II sporulation protein E (SpoIIE)